MLAQFARDSAIYGAASVLARGSAFLLLPILARALSPAEIGVVDVLTIAVALASVTIALEIGQGFARFYGDEQLQSRQRTFATTAMLFVGAANTLVVVLLVLAAPWVSNVLFGSDRADVVRAAAAAAWIAGLFQIVLNRFRYDLLARDYAIASVAAALITVGLGAALVVFARTGPSGVFIGQAVGGMIGIFLALRRYGAPVSRDFDTAALRAMLAFSIPLVPSSIGVFILVSIDRLSINALMTLDDVGVFGVGYRVAQIVGLVMVAVQLALTPLIYRRQHEPETPREIARLFRIFCAGAIIVCVALGLLGRDIISIVATSTYVAAAVVIPFLAPAILFANMYVFAPGLALAKRTGAIAAINLLGAGMNVTLNLALIRWLGVTGAALATLLSTATVFGLTMVASQRFYPVPHRWLPLSLAAGVAVALVLAGLAVRLEGPLQLLWSATMIAVAGATCVRANLVTRTEIVSLVARLPRLGAA